MEDDESDSRSFRSQESRHVSSAIASDLARQSTDYLKLDPNIIGSRPQAFVGTEMAPLQRKRTMTRPDNNPSHVPRARQNILANEKGHRKFEPWRIFWSAATCCFPNALLVVWKVHSQASQQAWREKVALCLISIAMCGLLGYITFFLQNSFCLSRTDIYSRSSITMNALPMQYVVHGKLYDMSPLKATHSELPPFRGNAALNALVENGAGLDVSSFFPLPIPAICARSLQGRFTVQCSSPQFPGITGCHNAANVDQPLKEHLVGIVNYDWDDISASNGQYTVYANRVVDMTQFLRSNTSVFGTDIDQILRSHTGHDITKALKYVPNGETAGECMAQLYSVGQIDSDTLGCFTAKIVLYISLILVGSLIIVKFMFALWFQWTISQKLGSLEKSKKAPVVVKVAPPTTDQLTHKPSLRSPGEKKSQSSYGQELYTIMLVTCYSETESELKNTFDSLTATDYNEDYKVLFIIADGLVKGKGNSMTTPDIVLSLIEKDPNWPDPAPFPYLAIGEGSRALNFAKVYVGWYTYNDRSVPTIVVVKLGAPKEILAAKPGNRGKRDSQIMLMRFFEHITFNERLCPFEYDLFQKLHYLMGVTPDHFEIVLMVDADTKVASDSLARMVACMKADPLVMGLCGETRISNNRIQVFEYYLSHHLTKAFESCFGGVTCLPGCFSMYRIKAPKNGGWVPILACPDIVSIYSSSNVDTLHKKNLLLLGEDRFLTTMMLRAFPKRKLIFVPRAYCKTTVPNTFSILLSQRRRWINSTVHNLMELTLVNELCGTFCFSMQFVIILELIGTVTLPAAIIFTFSIITPPQDIVQFIPLILLGGVLGLPAVLILLTTRRLIYIYWLLVYLTALPVWNFVLPVYAFWHFDDFSWGETRQIEGDGDKNHGDGDKDQTSAAMIPWKKWEEWERQRRRHLINSTAAR